MSNENEAKMMACRALGALRLSARELELVALGVIPDIEKASLAVQSAEQSAQDATAALSWLAAEWGFRVSKARAAAEAKKKAREAAVGITDATAADSIAGKWTVEMRAAEDVAKALVADQKKAPKKRKAARS